MTIYVSKGGDMNREEAEMVIAEDNKRKNEEFFKEYVELCKKHGRELTAQVSWIVAPINKPKDINMG